MANTLNDLKMLQALPLEVKVEKSKQRIREWVEYWGEDGVYVSFSGGKDSTVLLDLVRSEFPNVEAVFVDTGLEYPQIREFVKSFSNVTWLKPEMTFKQVIEERGYPFISKEIAEAVSAAKRGYKSGIQKLNGLDKNDEPSIYRKGFQKWKFLIDSPFKLSEDCCHINKKAPCKKYEKQTGKKAFLGMMADEGKMRQISWIKHGCNAWNTDRPMSSPLSFWTEQDVYKYILQNHLKIASVYGDIVPENSEDQLSFFEDENTKYKTTGCQRTGCTFCGFGCHFKDDERFIKLREFQPQIYDWIMKPTSDGGLNYKEIIDWINEHGKLNIRY